MVTKHQSMPRFPIYRQPRKVLMEGDKRRRQQRVRLDDPPEQRKDMMLASRDATAYAADFEEGDVAFESVDLGMPLESAETIVSTVGELPYRPGKLSVSAAAPSSMFSPPPPSIRVEDERRNESEEENKGGSTNTKSAGWVMSCECSDRQGPYHEEDQGATEDGAFTASIEVPEGVLPCHLDNMPALRKVAGSQRGVDGQYCFDLCRMQLLY